jgi:hypothetical protein
VAAALSAAARSSGEPAFVAPRGPGGKPDLNGTWQVMSRANDGLETHAASKARALRDGPHGPVPAKEVLALGAVGAVPAGLGVVVGDEIPYQDWARKKQAENQAHWLTMDPEVKCYLPGIPRATYLPYPFQIFHNESALFFAYEYAGAVRNIHLVDPGPAPIRFPVVWRTRAYAIQSAPAARPGSISRLPVSATIAACLRTLSQPSSVVGASSIRPSTVMIVPAESQITSAAGSRIHSMVCRTSAIGS